MRGLGIALAAVYLPFTAPAAQQLRPAQVTPSEPLRNAPQSRDAARDALVRVLDDALRGMSEGEEAGANLRQPILGEANAAALIAIGKAYAALGDFKEALKSWKLAVDAAGRIENPERCGWIIEELVVVLNDSGEHNAARDILERAAVNARAIGSDPQRPRLLRPRSEEDQFQTKALSFALVATLEARLGDAATARTRFAEAITAAESIRENIRKAAVISEVAGMQPRDEAEKTWAQATRFAESLSDQFEKAKALECVLRNRVRLGGIERALATLRDDVNSNLKSYLLWAVADELASGEREPPADAVAQVLALAEKTEFDRDSRKGRVFTAIAGAQARLGNSDAAYKTFGSVEPGSFSVLLAKVRLMCTIARGQLKARAKDVARDTLQVAVEIVNPYLGDDEDSLFPLPELAELLVQVGDAQGALRMAEAIRNASCKIRVLAALAVALGQSGNKAGALAVLGRAAAAVAELPEEALWATTPEVPQDPLVQEVANRLPREFVRRKQLSFEIVQVPHAFELIALARVKVGDVAGATKTAGMIPIVADLSSILAQARAYCAIARAQANAKDCQAAAESLERVVTWYRLEEIGAEGPVVSSLVAELNEALIKLGEDRVKAGDVRGALKWAMEQRPSKAKIVALQGVAQGIAALKSPKRKIDP